MISDLKRTTSLCLGVLSAVCFLAPSEPGYAQSRAADQSLAAPSKAAPSEAERSWGFDTHGMHRETRPGDNFFDYANGAYLKDLAIPSDRTSFGPFDILAVETRKHIKGILEAARQKSAADRASLIATLLSLPKHPESVPINLLVRVAGTPLANAAEVDPITFTRVVATARIVMPASHIRLAAGRELLSDEAHALIFLAGANSIFCGDKLLTTPNPAESRDRKLLAQLGMNQPNTTGFAH